MGKPPLCDNTENPYSTYKGRMSDEKGTASPPAPAKYSRYRSVRQQAEASKSPPPVTEQKNDDAPVSRSMSRYRRPKSVIPRNDQATSPQSLPPIPTIPRVPDLRSPTRRVTEPVPSSQRIIGNDRYGGRQASRPRETETERLQRKATESQSQEEQQRRAERDRVEQNRREEQHKLDTEAEQARLADELLAEQKRKDLERLEAELDAASPGVARVASPRDKFGFFSRKRAATKVTSPSTAASRSRSTSEELQTKSQGRGSEQGGGNAAPIPESRKRSQDAPTQAIEQGGRGIVPGTDAPMSAVNAGERVSYQNFPSPAGLTNV
jgi:hypothetical protein